MKKRLVLSVLLIMALLFSLMPVASAATIDDVDDQCLRLGPDVYSIYSDNYERERIAQSLASENVIYFKWEGRWYDLKALTSYFDLVPANAVPDEEVNQWDLHYWYKTGDIIEEFTSGLTKEEAIQQAINAIAALPNPDLVTVETYFDYEPSIREARLFVEEAVELGANYSDITNLWLLELLEQRLDELWPEIVQAAKDNLAGDVGDKAAEVDIEGISVVFTAETRTADITVGTPLASILELENTGLMVMLGELDTIRGYTVNGVTRSFYNEAGERLSNADIKAMILADAFTALGLDPADEPLMRDLDGKSLSVLVHGKDGRVEFEDTYHFNFAVVSVYGFSYDVPSLVIENEEVLVPVTFGTEELGSLGLTGVRFQFFSVGAGDVTFKATDSSNVEHTFFNAGVWGPPGGFDLPAAYTATTDWKLTFASAGVYTITFQLVKFDTGDVLYQGSVDIEVVVPSPPDLTLDGLGNTALAGETVEFTMLVDEGDYGDRNVIGKIEVENYQAGDFDLSFFLSGEVWWPVQFDANGVYWFGPKSGSTLIGDLLKNVADTDFRVIWNTAGTYNFTVSILAETEPGVFDEELVSTLYTVTVAPTGTWSVTTEWSEEGTNLVSCFFEVTLLGLPEVTHYELYCDGVLADENRYALEQPIGSLAIVFEEPSLLTVRFYTSETAEEPVAIGSCGEDGMLIF